MQFEMALDRLQLVVKKLESGDLPLEEALRAFEEGVQLARTCQERLSEAEKKVEILSKSGTGSGDIELKPFGSGE